LNFWTISTIERRQQGLLQMANFLTSMKENIFTECTKFKDGIILTECAEGILAPSKKEMMPYLTEQKIGFHFSLS
jgi:hypothetical protein